MKPQKEKNSVKGNLMIAGSYVERYWNMYVLLLAVIIAVEAVLIIRSVFMADLSDPIELGKTISLIILLAITVGMMVFLILNLKKRREVLTGLAVHIYAAVAIAWATAYSAMDMSGAAFGLVPLAYITVMVIIAGIVVLNTCFFGGCTVISFVTLLALNGNYEKMEDTVLINILILVGMSCIMAWKNYRVGLAEFKIRDRLRVLSYRDHLTGLGNETSYFELVDEIEKEIAEGKANFAIMVMDVNNVKATNDMYGHRFGCHLIVTAGKILSSIFKRSRLFHIGGDEFVGIIRGKDYDELDNLMKQYGEKLLYSHISFEGKDLILSVASGVVKADGREYKDLFQEADRKMYENKEEIKKKYRLSER